MTGRQIVGGIAAVVVSFGCVGLVVVTNGWFFWGFALFLLVFALFAIGAGMAGR